MIIQDQQKHIENVYEILKTWGDDLDVLQHLRAAGVEPDDQEEIISQAKSQLLKEKLKYLPQRSKRIFLAWLFAALAITVYFFFYLPGQQLYQYSFILSFLGTFLLMLCLYLAFLYYKTWTVAFLQTLDAPKINFSFFPFFLIPGVVVYFILSWRFSSAANQSLIEHMEKARGTIVAGQSITSKSIDFTEVTVEFITKEGKQIIATEDISKYAFNKFYKGQSVDLIYSTINPYNIDLLTSEHDVTGLTGSEERSVTPQDLVSILSADKESVSKQLDQIAFGWTYNPAFSSWTNFRKNIKIKIADNEITYTTPDPVLYIFPKYLEGMGFDASAENSDAPFSRKEKIFQNENYRVVIQFKAVNGKEMYITTLTKQR